MRRESSRPEAAFVLMLLQATFWIAAGLSSLPFVFAGEPFMLLLAAASFALAALAIGLAAGAVKRSRGARRWTLGLESVCLGGAILQQLLPIGANHGSVALLVNVALPAAVIALMWRKEHERERDVPSTRRAR
jgi:hypothetical protein